MRNTTSDCHLLTFFSLFLMFKKIRKLHNKPKKLPSNLKLLSNHRVHQANGTNLVNQRKPLSELLPRPPSITSNIFHSTLFQFRPPTQNTLPLNAKQILSELIIFPTTLAFVSSKARRAQLLAAPHALPATPSACNKNQFVRLATIMSYLCPAFADKRCRRMMRYNTERNWRHKSRISADDNFIQTLITVSIQLQIHWCNLNRTITRI